MGLNGRDMQLRLCRVLQVSAEISYTFIQKHPLVSGALLVFFILYIFLSYIYNFLVYVSPFLVCTAIFVGIFWSSEQNLLKYVNREEKKREEESDEPKYPKVPKYKRRELLYKYPSQNATSRRRNFTGRKLDVYGGLEEKAKDLSAVFCNEFTKKSTNFREAKYIKKEEGSLDYELSAKENETPTKQTLFSEPSMRDLVIYGAECGGPEKEAEKKNDEEEAQQDRNKGVELKEDDQKNLMDLGLAEMERNKRLESLIARRRARKLLKLQIENGLIDVKSVIPSEIAPLFIARVNPFDSPKEFEGIDGIEMPGSAPSALRSPFDLPYDPNEEKPNLKGDSFDQEFTSHQKDMQFCRHESFSSFPLEPRQDFEAREYRLAYPRVRRLPGKGNNDWLEQLTSKEGSESESKAPSLLSEVEEITHEEDGKYKTDMADMKDKQVENAHATKSMSDHTSEPDLIPKTANVESAIVSEKPGPRVPKPHERVLNFPTSSTSATNINDSLYESLSSPVDKNRENMLFNGRRISHTPSHSISSDLQVEVSEVGSPTLTVDESHETLTTTDGESVVYDGDIDKDITSGSEDMWGASLHSREVRGVSEQDISEVNNWRDIASPFTPKNIDEENAADVSSMSSGSNMLEDTPTYAISSDHNFFGNVKDFVGETDAPHPSHSSDVSSRWKRLMRLVDKTANHLPHETHSEKSEEWGNLSEDLINKAQVINDVNNSVAAEQDNTHNSKCNEDNTSVVRQEANDEVSINSSLSSSPRSVLPQKTIADQVSSSAYNQEMHLGVQQSNMEDMAQATLNGEGPLDTVAQNIQSSMDDPAVESHNGDFRHSQERTYPPENSIQESNMSSKLNGAEVCNNEDEEKLKNDENSEDKFTPLIRQDATAEPPRLAMMMTSDDMNEKSRELFDDKVSLNNLMLESSLEVQRENEDKSQASMRQEATTEPFNNAEAADTSSAKDFEGKHNNLNKNKAIFSSFRSAGESDKLSDTDKPNHSSEEMNYELKQLVADHMAKEKLDSGNISEDSSLPMIIEATNVEDTAGEFDKMNKNESMVLSESTGESDKVSNIAHMKEHEEVIQLEDVGTSKPGKPNDSSKEVGYFQKESIELVEDDIKKDKQASSDDNENEDLPQPRVNEPKIPSKGANEGLAEDS